MGTVKTSAIFDGMTKEESVQEIETNKKDYATLASMILTFAQDGIKELNPKATPVEVLIGSWKQLYSNAIANGNKDDAESLKATCKRYYYFSIKREPTEELDKLFEKTWKTIKVKKY